MMRHSVKCIAKIGCSFCAVFNLDDSPNILENTFFLRNFSNFRVLICLE